LVPDCRIDPTFVLVRACRRALVSHRRSSRG
jgi:hypothetical protein